MAAKKRYYAVILKDHGWWSVEIHSAPRSEAKDRVNQIMETPIGRKPRKDHVKIISSTKKGYGAIENRLLEMNERTITRLVGI